MTPVPDYPDNLLPQEEPAEDAPFGRYVEYWRLRRGFASQSAAAQASGLSGARWARIEADTYAAYDAETLAALAAVLQRPVEEVAQRAGFSSALFAEQEEGDAPAVASFWGDMDETSRAELRKYVQSVQARQKRRRS